MQVSSRGGTGQNLEGLRDSGIHGFWGRSGGDQTDRMWLLFGYALWSLGAGKSRYVHLVELCAEKHIRRPEAMGSSAGSEECTAQVGGSLQCWGKNLFGQLGNGATSPVNSSPVLH